MYNFQIKVCVTKALSDFSLDPNLINKENNNNSKGGRQKLLSGFFPLRGGGTNGKNPLSSF